VGRHGDLRIIVDLLARERNSIIAVERDDVAVATARVLIGDYYFSNDVSICVVLPAK
jgi:hypothetical protein